MEVVESGRVHQVGTFDRYGLPGYTVGIGSKGCVRFAPTRITDYATFRKHQDEELTELA